MVEKLLTPILLVFLLILIQPIVFAQNKDRKKGLKYFANKEYKFAIPLLKKYSQSKKNIETDRKLFTCYIATKQNKKALLLGTDLVKQTKADAIDYLKYADLLKKLHKYKDAEKWYTKYYKLNPSNKIIRQHIKACKLIKEFKNDTLYITTSIHINTNQTDYITSLYKDGIVFVSGRENKLSKRINKETKDHYFNLYFSKKINNKYSSPQALSANLNSKYYEGSASFSSNEKFIYFSRNKGVVDLNGQSQLQIYMSRYNNENWDKPELFPHTSDKYSTGHPSISKDGKLLFFISNMPGGYGGTDIYYCKKQDFSWSSPVNLGPTINTSGNEMFPYIDKNNSLYFSSNGHIGLGGLDIFKSIFKQNSWSYPINMGYPFNSNKDDFAYLFDYKKQIGYFSSNRNNNNDDIFEFQINPKKQKILKGKISQLKFNNPIDSVTIYLADGENILNKTYTNTYGKFNFNILKNKKYSLIIKKQGFKTKRILYVQHNLSKDKELKIKLEESLWTIIRGFIKNESSSNPIEGAKIELINKTYKISNHCETDACGQFILNTDTKNDYDLLVSKRGYFTTVLTNYTHKNTQSIYLSKKNKTIELQTSAFLNQSWLLSENTKNKLNNIINILNYNTDVIVEIRTNTKINKKTKTMKGLCLKKASQIINYITTQGIPGHRIKIKSTNYDSRQASIIVKLIE